MKHPSTEQARKDAYKAATAVLVSERVNRSTWQEKGRGEAQDQQERVAEMLDLNTERLEELLSLR